METDNIDDAVSSKFVPNRVVHLDLKGSAPKINYLLRMIPLFRQWGANGLLVEYEDMFPYKNDLSVCSREIAYSSEDIRSIQDLAKAEGMKYIPLLQSFGHLEFILKKKQYAHLRESNMNPGSLCPTHKESLSLIEEIVDQFIEEHSDIEYLHIGGDEVFCLGMCKECLESNQLHKQLYLSHMMPLIKLIKSKHPSVELIIWDDMIREFSISELEQLTPVIPMVWSYVDDLYDQFPHGMWQSYSDVFDEIWIASSFKGSSGPICDIPPIQHHINNHLSWLYLLENLDKKIITKIKGISFTGWSRYDHFATLCELLPVAFPSLVLCLQIFKQKCFSKELHLDVSKQLGYENSIPLSNNIIYDFSCGNFPGSELIHYIVQLEHAKRQLGIVEERIDGWVDMWHAESIKELNFGHLAYISNVLNQIVQTYNSIKSPLQECLSGIFYEDTVQEFVKVKVDAKLKKCINLISNVEDAKRICLFDNDITEGLDDS
ncbi:hexosaminidase D [Hydra vulgaris]|uniref:beta-N-acetylhexosaminidase n=1 Tax=Hydra vulgaris TaxID=6087 RepID=A0ABM4BES5_HYDVU